VFYQSPGYFESAAATLTRLTILYHDHWTLPYSDCGIRGHGNVQRAASRAIQRRQIVQQNVKFVKFHKVPCPSVAVLCWGQGAQAPKSCPGPQIFFPRTANVSITKFRKVPELFPNRKVRTEQLWLHLIMHRTIGLTGYIGPLILTRTLTLVR